MTQPRKEQLSKLITGTPDPANVGDSPATGSSGFASPSDHTHAHGIHTDQTLHQAATSSSAGFMSAVQASQLNSANKASVLVATTADITLSGVQTIDGVAVVAGNRILVKDQSTGSQNGIYVVANAAWSRATDLNLSIQAAPGAAIYVEQGTVHTGSIWILITPNPITLGSTTLTFSRLVLLASSNETLGNNLASGGTTTIVAGSSGNINFKNGTNTTFAISSTILTVSSGITLATTLASASASTVFWQGATTDATREIYQCLIQGDADSAVDDVASIGWNPKQIEATKSSANWTIERDFATDGGGSHCYEGYLEFAGPAGANIVRPFFSFFNKATGKSSIIFEYQGAGVIGMQDAAGNPVAGFSTASVSLNGVTCNLGAAATTTTTNLWASSAHQRFGSSSTLIDSAAFDTAGGLVDAGSTLAYYVIRANATRSGSGQILALQASATGSSVALSSPTITFDDATGAGSLCYTVTTSHAGTTKLSFATGTLGIYTQDDAVSGAGKMFSIYAQKGGSSVGNVGGILRIGGGSTAAATTLAGATQIDLGTSTSNISAKLSLLVSGSSVLDISQTAASTITHDYGSNVANILTSSSIVLNTSIIKVGTSNYASMGLLRLENASAAGILGGDSNGIPLVMRNFGNTGDLRVFQCNANDDFVFGSQDPRDIYIRCSRNVLLLGGGGTWTFGSTGSFAMPSGSGWDSAGIGFAEGATATIYQTDKVSSGVGATFNIIAQKGSGANAGGILKIGGGASGDGTTVAGATQINLGTITGSSVSAKAQIFSSSGFGVDFYQIDSTKFLIEFPTAATTIIQQKNTTGTTQIGQNGHAAIEIGWSNSHSTATVRLGTDGYLCFFNTSTPIARPSAVGKFTNNTGGASSSVLAAIVAGAVYAQSDMVAVKDAIASISDKLAAYENVISDAQGGLGLTA